jgi:Zn-dependent protease
MSGYRLDGDRREYDHEPMLAPEPLTAEQRLAERRGLLARIFGPVAVGGGLLLKFGGLVKFASIFVALGGYALIWGWKWAVGFVGLILIHELGHYFEARRLGLNPSLPVFLPFLGAYVALRNAPFDPWRSARVSMAGPVVGGLGALAFLVIGEASGSRLLTALAYTGFLLNLFNMIPIGFLDGGHMMQAWRILRRGGGRPRPEDARRLGSITAVLGIATAVALAFGMWASHVPQDRL